MVKTAALFIEKQTVAGPLDLPSLPLGVFKNEHMVQSIAFSVSFLSQRPDCILEALTDAEKFE